MCNQYGVFILTATQLNADYVSAQQYDQNLLRGAKAIADKIDCGMIMLEVSQEDLTALDTLIKKKDLNSQQSKYLFIKTVEVDIKVFYWW